MMTGRWYNETELDENDPVYAINIDGRKYDSGTAKFIAGYEYKDSSCDFSYEELYQKRTGEYFLVRELFGHDYNYGGVGVEILPLTDEEAKKWQNNPYSLADKDGFFVR